MSWPPQVRSSGHWRTCRMFAMCRARCNQELADSLRGPRVFPEHRAPGRQRSYRLFRGPERHRRGCEQAPHLARHREPEGIRRRRQYDQPHHACTVDPGPAAAARRARPFHRRAEHHGRRALAQLHGERKQAAFRFDRRDHGPVGQDHRVQRCRDREHRSSRMPMSRRMAICIPQKTSRVRCGLSPRRLSWAARSSSDSPCGNQACSGRLTFMYSRISFCRSS